MRVITTVLPDICLLPSRAANPSTRMTSPGGSDVSLHPLLARMIAPSTSTAHKAGSGWPGTFISTCT